MQYYLGIDCGGSFVKVGLFDELGRMHSCVRFNTSLISPRAGLVERDMKELWQMCAKAIRANIEQSGVDAGQILAVSISAQGKGCFLLDKNQKPLGNAILSSDQRSLEVVKHWQTENKASNIYPTTYQTLWTGHPVSILRYLKENEPKRYEDIGAVLMTHDYLRFCLTGNLACEETNISESNLYEMEKGEYSEKLAKEFGIEEILEKLPKIIKSDEIAGEITKEVGELTGLKAGTIVVGGLFDVVSSAITADLQNENYLNVVLGTWSIVSGISKNLDATSKLVHGKYVGDNFIIHDASPTSAGNLEWFIKNWNLNYEEINQTIASLEPAQSSVLFIPFLYGSNALLGMQGGFYGMQSYHNKGHLLQAIFEGVLFSLMHHLERMQKRFTNVSTLRVTGGAVNSNIWMQMLSDLTGLNLEIPQVTEPGCMGAILIAMKEEQRKQILQNIKMRKIEPNAKNYQFYQEKYARYKNLITALQAMH